MKRLLLTALTLTTCGSAHAASTSLQEYVQGSGGKIKIEDGLFVVSKRTRDLNYITLGVGAMGQNSQGRLNQVGVFAFKHRLSAAEVELLAANVARIASKCFNISKERGDAMTAWLTKENQTLMQQTTKGFGPMNLTFVRSITRDGEFFTAVHMQRTGTPGVAPWINYCVR